MLIEARKAFEGQENASGGRECDVEGPRRCRNSESAFLEAVIILVTSDDN